MRHGDGWSVSGVFHATEELSETTEKVRFSRKKECSMGMEILLRLVLGKL
jgi:catalase